MNSTSDSIQKPKSNQNIQVYVRVRCVNQAKQNLKNIRVNLKLF